MSSQQSISSRPGSGRDGQYDLSQARKNLDESTKLFREMILADKGRTPKQETPKKESPKTVRGPSSIPPHLWNIQSSTTLASQNGNRNSDPGSAASNGNTTKTTSATTIGQSAGRTYGVSVEPRQNRTTAATSDEQCTTSPEGGVRLSVTSSDGQSPGRTRPALSPKDPIATRYPQLAASRHAMSWVPRSGSDWQASRNQPANFNSRGADNSGAHGARQHESSNAVTEAEPKLPVIQAQKPSSSRHMSSRGSVTSLGGSDISDISDIEPHKKPVIARRKDIRGEIDLQQDIAKYNEKVANMSWEELANSDFPNETVSFLHRFILDWVKDIPDAVHTSFLEDTDRDHWLCDVDTDTGYLISQVAQPYTAPPAVLDENLEWRQQNMTSRLVMRDQLSKLTRKVKRDERKDREIEQQNWIRIPRPLPPIEVDPRTPKIPIHLCRAGRGHLTDCLEIYNREVNNGDQAIDTDPLCLEDFQSIFKRCTEERTPFIVAVQGTSKEARLRHEGAAAVTGSHDGRAVSVDKVLGFGFVSLCERGLADGYIDVTGRFCGKLHIFVDQEYRRKGIGRVLLDKLMYICSDSMPFLDCYEWLSAPSDPGQVYRSGFDQARGYKFLFVDVFYDDNDEEKAVEWQAKLLGEYRFQRIATFEKLHYSKASPTSIAKTKAVYMHCCRLLGPNRELRKPDGGQNLD